MTDTNVVIHCPSCGVRLHLPADSAGRLARCPGCHNNFQVPNPDAMLDDMVTCWLDLDAMDDDEYAAELARAESLRGGADDADQPDRPADADGDDGAAGDDDNAPRAGDDEAAAPAPAASKPASTRRASHSRSLRRPSRPFKSHAAPAPPRPVEAEADAPADDEPAKADAAPLSFSAAPAGDSPRLRVMKITSGGVRFRFASKLLDLPAFRASMPMCDVFTGERGEGVKLTARPLAWVDKAKGGSATSYAGELEARYEMYVRGGSLPIDVIESMRTMEELPPPFCAPMPYYVAKGTEGRASVHCESFHTPQGIFCEVVVPSAPVALEWLMRVNGVCGDEYLELEQQVRKLESTTWQAVPEKVRNRLVVWFDFVPGERFLAYFNDGDFSAADAGLAGLIVTDRRLVYCKFHSHGSVPHDTPATIVAVRSGRFSTLAVRDDRRDKRLVKLRHEDLTELAVLLDEVESQLDLVAEQAPEPEPEPVDDESGEGAEGEAR